VIDNQESTRRQYQLAERARQMGWTASQIEVVDDDLGLSGASSQARLGFQRLVAAIGLGEVGIVLVTEVSRLSRRNSDWHRVIELCAVFRTLIADEDGVYDAQDPNDLLLLGVKGTLFAAELHILRARMRGNLLNKARRGELALRLPVGYRRLGDGTVVLEPDEQVRATLTLLFERFDLLRNARAVQRYFLEHGLAMPRLIQQGAEAGRIAWVRPTYQMIQQVLTSPVYAGVFVYGRRQRQVAPGDPPIVADRRRPVEEWDIVVPGIYPAYLSYDQYLLNRHHLHDNLYNFAAKGRGAPREGRALLQGLVVCGRCGRRMAVSHGSRYHRYECRRAQIDYAAPQCQAFPVAYLDRAVGALFLAAVQPAALETAWRPWRCSSASARRSTVTGSCGSSGRATRHSGRSGSTTPPSRRTAPWHARSRPAGTRHCRRSSSWTRNTRWCGAPSCCRWTRPSSTPCGGSPGIFPRFGMPRRRPMSIASGCCGWWCTRWC
jgi:DNA invertase Pin-like site-specific DNA recombinase